MFFGNSIKYFVYTYHLILNYVNMVICEPLFGTEKIIAHYIPVIAYFGKLCYLSGFKCERLDILWYLNKLVITRIVEIVISRLERAWFGQLYQFMRIIICSLKIKHFKLCWHYFGLKLSFIWLNFIFISKVLYLLGNIHLLNIYMPSRFFSYD